MPVGIEVDRFKSAALANFGRFGNFGRFLTSGAFNTLATYVLYLALLPVLPYRWSYTIAYATGIVLAYLLYRYLVFGSSGGRYGPLWVALIYFFQYLLGLALVSFWVQVLGAPALWAPAFAIAIATPLSYLLNRWVFRADRNKADLEPAATTAHDEQV
jgi:putative flippase GtrA